jgi:hypothetical protein
MAKRKDYVPIGDNDFHQWQEVLVKNIVSNKIAWGIPNGNVAELQARQGAYETEYSTMSKPSTRTSGAVLAHRSGRKGYEKYVRAFVKRFISANDSITVEQRKGMGVNAGVRKRGVRSHITESPDVHLKSLIAQQVDIVCRKPASEGRPALHHDSDVIEFRYKICSIGPAGLSVASPPPSPDDIPPANYKEAREVMTSTKARFVLTFTDPSVSGKWMYVYARYKVNSDDSKSGPWSAVACVRIY